ncbi:hypothetical protein B0H13DRAFT_2316321 [Mycena leptocephala]|nr:hypothetical protein B0H13DRAFT_2316321 [Mycena leptocephala]
MQLPHPSIPAPTTSASAPSTTAPHAGRRWAACSCPDMRKEKRGEDRNAPVFLVFALSVVANVIVAPPASSPASLPAIRDLGIISEERQARTGNPGAGTSMAHVCAVVSLHFGAASANPLAEALDQPRPTLWLGLLLTKP